MKDMKIMTYYLLSVAVLFVLSSTRSIFIPEEIAEWGLFLFLLTGIYFATKVKAVWIAFYFYLLTIFYNPFILIFHDMQYSYIADIIVALTFFYLALKWKAYAFEKPMEII